VQKECEPRGKEKKTSDFERKGFLSCFFGTEGGLREVIANGGWGLTSTVESSIKKGGNIEGGKGGICTKRRRNFLTGDCHVT